MSDLKYHPATVEDREKLSDQEWEEISEKLEELKEDGLDHPDVKLVPNSMLERPVWQLTVDREHSNHRVFLDIMESTTVVLAIWNFEFTHSGDKHWEEVDDRMK